MDSTQKHALFIENVKLSITGEFTSDIRTDSPSYFGIVHRIGRKSGKALLLQEHELDECIQMNNWLKIERKVIQHFTGERQ